MKLIGLREEYLRIKQKGYERGFTIQEYFDLKKVQDQIDGILCSHQQKWMDFYNEVESLIRMLHTEGLFHVFSEKNIGYIKENAYLLPLVLANDKKKNYEIHGDNVYFSCQFHREKTPSLRVSNKKNWGYCFGCGTTFNSIGYLQLYEDIKFQKSLALLAQIYLFDIKKENPKFNSLVQHYQQAILSEEYSIILNRCLEKLEKKCSQEELEKVYEEYKMRLNTIQRIHNHEYDNNFVYEEPKRRVYLEKVK